MKQIRFIKPAFVWNARRKVGQKIILIGCIVILVFTYGGLSSHSATLLDEYYNRNSVDRIPAGIATQLRKDLLPEKLHPRIFTEGNFTVFHNVCIRSSKIPTMYKRNSEKFIWKTGTRKLILPNRRCYHHTKIIEVYGSSEAPSTPYTENIHGFNVTFIKSINGSVPTDHKYDSATAYFFGYDEYFAPENFFHFMKQFLFPLHYAASKMDQLKPRSRNVPLYHRPWGRCPGFFSRFKTERYHTLFKMLNVDDIDVYSSPFEDQPHPDRICYKQAVFTPDIYTEHALSAIKFMQRNFGVDLKKCDTEYVVIIKRKIRKILNLQELYEVAVSMGYNTKLVSLETMSYNEQAQLILCTNILIGVTGAGLQWSYFMRPHSYVVEIAWPTHEWPFFFSSTSDKYNARERDILPLNYFQIEAKNCKIPSERINEYILEAFHTTRNFTAKIRKKIINHQQNYNFTKNAITNLGKLCDVTVPVEDLKETLMKIKKMEKLKQV